MVEKCIDKLEILEEENEDFIKESESIKFADEDSNSLNLILEQLATCEDKDLIVDFYLKNIRVLFEDKHKFYYHVLTDYFFADLFNELKKRKIFESNVTYIMYILKDNNDYCQEFRFAQKLFDHLKLALMQMDYITTQVRKQNEIKPSMTSAIIEPALNDIVKRVDNQISEFKENFRTLIDETNDDIAKLYENTKKEADGVIDKIITILAIFSAISFSVFGGMNAISNIFSNTYLSLHIIILLGSLFGIIIIAIVYSSFEFIAAIINRNKPDEFKLNLGKGKIVTKLVNLLSVIFVICLLIEVFLLVKP